MEQSEKKVIHKNMQARTVPDEVLEAMSLKNRYAFINANMMSVLDDSEKDFIGKVQRFCLKYEKKIRRHRKWHTGMRRQCPNAL
jgi:hypothetical protein